MYFKNLEAEKARKRVTDEQLAKVIGLKHRENFTKKKATGSFSIEQMRKLADFFGVSMDYLTEHDED